MIDSTHPQFDEMSDLWFKCRATYQGEAAVKAAKTKFVPKLGAQDSEQYDSYLTRASFFNGVAKTVDGMVGTSMRVDPTITGVSEELLADVTNTGITARGFINYLLTEQLLMGRQGVMVDHDGERPYLSGYRTEQIINWFDSGAVVLSEQYLAPDDEDPYKQSFKTQYRELTLSNGEYVVNIWREVPNGRHSYQWEVVESFVPSNKGAGLDSIPFFGSSVDGLNLSPETPPLMPLVDMNLSHFRSSADLEHGRHFTALPTAYILGVKDVGTVRLGAETVLVIPNEKAVVDFLEFTGQGLASLEEAVTQKAQMMAALGAQLISGQRKGVESFESLALKQNAEMAQLMTAIQRTEDLATAAFQSLVDWSGSSETVSVKMNTEFGLQDEDEALKTRQQKDRKQAQKEQKRDTSDEVI